MPKGSPIPGKEGRVVLSPAGIRDLLNSPEMMAELRKRMQKVQSALPGSELEVVRGKGRARAKVMRGSDFDEANTGDLARALSLAGGKRGTHIKAAMPKARKASN